MSWTWAVRLPARALAHAASLRLWPGLEVLWDGEQLWLRGQGSSAELDLRLRALPGAERFARGTGERLVPAGKAIPCGVLAGEGWAPIAQELAPAAPATSLPGAIGERARLRLVRAGDEVAPDLLATSLAELAAWATTAAAVRLAPLAFTCDSRGRALVRGRPLPPLAGGLWVVRGKVAVPAGFRLEPRLPVATVEALLGLADPQLALFAPDASFERVPLDAFVHASRAAVRATLRDHDA